MGPIKVIQTLVNTLTNVTEIKINVFYLDRIVDPQVKMNVPVERLIPWRFPFCEYEIVHTNGIRPDFFAFVHRKKIKYHISTIHNLVFEDLLFTYNSAISWIFGNLWLILWRRTDRLVCLSKSMKNYYNKWLPNSKLEVIYNGISEDDNSFISDSDLVENINSLRSKGLIIIGTTGVLTRRKGIDQVMYLMAQKKEIALVIIGEGREKTILQNLARKLELNERILFCGFRENAVSYFKYFDFFIMPSRSEGFGLALVEAVQQKVPVLCSDLNVFHELFNNDEVTFYRLENLKSLCDALEVAKESGNVKVELAFNRYMNYYTGNAMAMHYLELYNTA